MTEYSANTDSETRHYCLRYHAWAATEQESESSLQILKRGSLGTNDDGQEVHRCLHPDCSLRLGSKALGDTLVLQDAGGFAACEMPKD